MNEDKYCRNHGLKMDYITLIDATRRDWFFKMMAWFSSRAKKYDQYGRPTMVYVCPKNDYLESE